MRFGDLAFYEHELGILSDERFESLIRYVTDQACAWAFQDIWSRLNGNFVADMSNTLMQRLPNAKRPYLAESGR